MVAMINVRLDLCQQYLETPWQGLFIQTFNSIGFVLSEMSKNAVTLEKRGYVKVKCHSLIKNNNQNMPQTILYVLLHTTHFIRQTGIL